MAPVAEKTLLQTVVELHIALTPVLVISKSTCPFCADAKKALKQAGADLKVIEIDRLPGGEQQMKEIQDHMGTLTGATTVPRVFIGRKFIGGGTETVKLGQAGELAGLVKAAEESKRKEKEGIHNSATVTKSEKEWVSALGVEAYSILRQRGTEDPWSHDYDKFLPEQGYFACGGCNLPLYSAESKFASTCGWPVFNKCYFSADVGCHVGTRYDGGSCLEIFCPRCNSHLGHVFFDALSAENPNGERH